jgi:hypothetical protein
MSILSNQEKPQKTPKYFCNICDFNTYNKKDYNRHIETIKHKSMVCQCFSIILPQKNPRLFTCYCGKTYNDNSGLWRHKKKYGCNPDISNNYTTIDVVKLEHNSVEKMDVSISKKLDVNLEEKLHNNLEVNLEVKNELTQKMNSDSADRDLIMMLIKQNTELMEIIKNGTTANSHNTTNSHNKAFNLNFFLNETCKDAMNITDFVDSIKLQLSDLEKVGELGYVEGISNIIVKNLNALDETARPLHCTDKKRETIYIKDQGQWEKEDDNKSRLKKAINKIAHKNIKLITQFREKYPECKKLESSISDKYNKMVIEAMGGMGNNTLEKEEKIIRNITKEITIKKSFY